MDQKHLAIINGVAVFVCGPLQSFVVNVCTWPYYRGRRKFHDLGAVMQIHRWRIPHSPYYSH